MSVNMRRAKTIVLTAVEGKELRTLVARDQTKGGQARRARVILLSAEGVTCRDIASRLGLSLGQVSRIRGRFERSGVGGLEDRPRAGRKDHAVPREKIDLVVSLAESPPPPGHARWSTRLIGRRLGLSSATVSKVLRSRRKEAVSAPLSRSSASPSLRFA
jgi:hypothetical protein